MKPVSEYAVVKTGGRQYRVAVGDRLRVARLSQEPGSTIDLDQVLLVARGEEVSVGSPMVAGVAVKARVEEHGRDSKITVFKFKHKVRYRRTKGHRQPYTELVIEEISTGRTRRRAKPKAKSEEKSEEA